MGATNQAAGATEYRFTLGSFHRGITDRTAFRHFEFGRIALTALQDHSRHLRDHVAGSAHHHPVSNAYIFTTHFIQVV